MHSKHLGTDKVVYASALHLLVFDLMGGADAAENMDVVWAAMDKWYKDNGVDRDSRFTTLRLGMICNVRAPLAKCPKLRGNQYKSGT